MNIYNIFFIILIFFTFFEIFHQKNEKNMLFNGIIFFYFILVSLRYETGPDYYSYRDIFNKINLYNFRNYEYLEIGYVYLNIIIKIMSNKFQLIIISMNVMIFIFLYKGILYFSKKQKGMFLFLFFSLLGLYYTFSVYRQGLAVCIAFYALKYLYEDKKKLYLFFILFASIFHQSILIMIPIYIISQIKMNKCTMFIIILIAFLIGQVIGLRGLIQYFYIDLGIENIFLKKAHFYFTEKGEGLDHQMTFLSLINKAFLFFLIFYYKESLLKLNTKNIFILNYSFWGAVIYFIFSAQPLFATRIEDNFLIYKILIYINIIKLSKKKQKILWILFFILYGIFFFERELYSIHPIRHVYNYLPYKIISNF